MLNKTILSSGVSIIVCTKKPQFINHIFQNYQNQRWRQKELIIVLNKDDLNIENYQRKAMNDKNVSIYKLPENFSLGKCLNFAVSKTKFNYIAKFDDDDYYAPLYITDSMSAFARTNADIVGKLTIFTYLEHRNMLLLLFPNMENKFVNRVAGGTIMAKRNVFQSVKFPDLTVGEDTRFQRVCRSKGFKIYSTDRYNFVGIRRKDPKNHTWIVSDRHLMNHGKKIAITQNYQAYANRFRSV